MIFKISPVRAGRVVVLTLAMLAVNACSPREQARGNRWKSQVDAYLQGREAPSESDWPLKVSEEEEDTVVRRPLTFSDIVEALPHPQSWPQLQSGMVLRFLAAQGKGDWRAEIQNRLLHLFFIYLNDSDRYSTKRWSKAADRLNARLDAIEARLPEDSPDRSLIEGVREHLAKADTEMKKRSGTGDGLGEVRAFEAELKNLEPLDRKEVAARVGGEAELAGMEKFLDEMTATAEKLRKKYKSVKNENDLKLMEEEAQALSVRYESQLEKYGKFIEDPLVQRHFTERMQDGLFAGTQSVEVPDLVTILGEARAAELLKRALLLPVVLDIPTGIETQALARKLALQYVEQLKAPQWELSESLQGVDLFEALQKRFPARPDESDYDYARNSAQIYYLFGLIAQGRSADALAWMGKIYPLISKEPEASYRWSVPSSLLEQMQEAGYEGQVWDFMAKLLDRHPEVPFWDSFIDLSSKLDRNGPMLELVERTAKRPGLSEKTKWKMQKNLADAYLAADRVEEGVAVLRSALSRTGSDADASRDRTEAGLQLAELGQLLQRSEWIEEGLAAAEASAADPQAGSPSYYQVSGLVKFYEKLGRTADAERIIKAGLQKLAEKGKAEAEEPGSDPGAVAKIRGGDGESDYLEALLALYVTDNRNGEAVHLLTQSPDWGKADLADFLGDSAGYPEYPVGYWAAWALGRLGRGDEASTVAKGQIRVEPGSDGAYAILTQLQGTQAIPYLDKIYRMDQFEERPLIWKAKVLSDAGELEEAEKAAQAAIAVDPSDGEQGKGDRMRVYAVMAEIAKKRGNEGKAKFFENVIRSIRLSEDADDYHRAGLNTRAIAMYKEALGFFSEAYCIQSRLALQLMKEKKEAEALEHYQKAYELMPDSFGRVESHCFGCEKAFEGKKAQGLAEKVFSEMLKKQPGKAQVHYLLGYLRQEQGRYAEALEYFRQAVALDPLYLNAWKHIEGLKDEVRIDPRVLDEVSLKLLALDPSGRHSSPDLKSVNDLPKLWGHLALADRVLNLVPAPEAVFELTASEEALREKKSEDEVYESGGRDGKTFAKIILDHPAVRSLREALEATRQKGGQAPEAGAEEMMEIY